MRPRLLGAPVGTELARRGFVLAAPAWSAAAIADAPGLLSEIHRDYVAAGADVVVANTTCTRPTELAEDAEVRCREAIAIARGAGVPVVATIAMSPRSLDAAERRATYAAQAGWSSGAEVLLLEGFIDVDELLLAIEATAAWTGPRWAALAGGAVSGIAEAIERAKSSTIAMWAVHCCTLEAAEDALRQVDRARLGDTSLGAWPNPPEDFSAAAFADALLGLVDSHALGVVGCCCGGTPRNTSALRAALAARVSSRP